MHGIWYWQAVHFMPALFGAKELNYILYDKCGIQKVKIIRNAVLLSVNVIFIVKMWYYT